MTKFLDVSKAVLRGKFTALNEQNSRKEEKSLIDDL